MWVYIGAGILIAFLFFVYALCRVAAMADLRAMRDYAAKPRKATDLWEEPTVGGGVYDAVQRGDFN